MAVINFLTEPATLYVNAATGSDETDGKLPTTAFKTIGRAVQAVRSTYVLLGYTVTISIADGTYGEQVTVSGISGGTVAFQGSADVLWTAPAGGICLHVADGCIVTVSGCTFGGPDAEVGMMVSDCSVLSLLGGHVFTRMASYSLLAQRNAILQIWGNYTVAGWSDAAQQMHLGIFDGAMLRLGTLTCTLQGPRFDYFLVAWRGGIINAGGETVVNFNGPLYGGGSGTRKYELALGSVCQANGKVWWNGAAGFPGGVAGTVATGGVYA